MKLEIEINKIRLIVAAINYNTQGRKTVFKIDYINEVVLDKLLVEDENSLDISIFYNDRSYTEFVCEPISIDVVKSRIQIYLDYQLPQYLYNQDVIDILFDWDKGINRIFYNLPETMKKAWLHACLVYSGLPSNIYKSVVEVDCKLINDEYDLFYLLGESFIGEKGYFGQDFEGVRDCLLLCGKTNNTKIIFKHSGKLDLIFEKTNVTRDDFLNVFSRLGYSLVLD